MNKKLKAFIKYLVVFCVPVALIVTHMYIAGCYPFGDKTILMGDANSQYISFVKLLIDKVKTGESILFDWHIGMGSEFYQIFCYYLASPFNLIAILIGMWNLEIGVIVTMIVQIGMCSVTMMYYLTHTNKLSTITFAFKDGLCMLFAVAYSLSDYLLAYQYNYIWLISLIMSPLVMLGVETLVEKRDIRLYSISLIIVFITNFYFAWFVCILSFVWFIDAVHGEKKVILIDWMKYIISSLLSTLSSCFVLLPCYLAVKDRPINSVNMEEGFADKFGSFANYIKGFLWGNPIDINGKVAFTNNNYVGMIVSILAFLYILLPNVELSRRIKRFFIISVFSFFQNWGVGVYIFHGFTFPNQLFSRNMFVLVLILIVTAFETIGNINSLDMWRIAVTGLFVIVCICMALFGSSTEKKSLSFIGSIFICAYILICLVLYSRKSIGKRVLIMNFIILGLGELITNAWIVSNNVCELGKDYMISTDAWKDEYEKVSTEAGTRKTSWIGSQNTMSYSDTNIYSSIMCRNMLNWNSSLGLAFQANGSSYAYKGSTPITAMLSNVRFVLTDQPVYFGGYDCNEEGSFYSKYMQSEQSYGLFESPYAVGLGFSVPTSILDWDMTENPFETQNQFTDNILDVGDAFSQVGDYYYEVQSNGCDIISDETGIIRYRNTMTESDRYSNILYSYIVPEDMDMYVCVKDLKQVISYVYVDSVPLEDNGYYLTQTEMLHVGNVKKGQIVSLMVSNNTSCSEESTTSIYVYKYNSTVMDKILNKVKGEAFNIEKITTTSVVGNITSYHDGILYTSIPYYKGFSAYVDGKKTEIIPIGNTMCGVSLTAGNHEVEFRYVPYGLRFGIILSAIGLTALVFYTKKKMLR